MSLVDTNVFSEVCHPQGDSRVKQSFLALGDQVRLSVIVLGEIRFGISLQRDAGKQAELASWYGRLVGSFGHWVLPVTMPISETWGDLSARLKGAGRTIEAPDGLIAATALVHDLTLWTRNTRDFADTGVRLFNPWED